jgi:hypothetical protein
MFKFIYNIWLTALLLFPFVLWILPSVFFDEGVEMCPSKLFFDVECFGCGITRSVMHLHHFELNEAIYYNYGIIWVYPFLVFLWFRWTKDALKNSDLGKFILEKTGLKTKL